MCESSGRLPCHTRGEAPGPGRLRPPRPRAWLGTSAVLAQRVPAKTGAPTGCPGTPVRLSRLWGAHRAGTGLRASALARELSGSQEETTKCGGPRSPGSEGQDAHSRGPRLRRPQPRTRRLLPGSAAPPGASCTSPHRHPRHPSQPVHSPCRQQSPWGCMGLRALAAGCQGRRDVYTGGRPPQRR